MDNIEIAKAIAVVRGTGKVNMFDRVGVIQILNALGYEEEAKILEDNRDKYMEYLKLSGKY